MSKALDQSLLEALLNSWDRNNAIILNLLPALPEGELEAKATQSSPSVARQFTHVHHEQKEEWLDERDKGRLTQMLNESAEAVRDAVGGRVLTGREMDLNYDHPTLMLQLLLWHEGYNHGQIKLALKVVGHPISDEEAGPLTWDLWRGRKRA